MWADITVYFFRMSFHSKIKTQQHAVVACYESVATADNSRESRRTAHQPENKARLSRSFFVEQAAAADVMFSLKPDQMLQLSFSN